MRGRGVVAFVALAWVPSSACDPQLGLVGQSCYPAEEDDPTFLGFDALEVRFEATSQDLAQPNAIVCMAYHFRGRTRCPYGQDATGTMLASGASFPPGGGPCQTSTGDPVVAEPDLGLGPQPPTARVEPQCTDRRPKDTVFWTCRCANADGEPDDTTCSCPGDTECTALVPPDGEAIVTSDPYYCLPRRAAYDMFASCLTACDPSTASCP